MQLTSIILENFKKIKKVSIAISPINILVGGNNSGKSSVLQGIHFSVVASIAARATGKLTFTQDNLQYCPAHDFVVLRNGAAYQNQSNFSYLKLYADEEVEEGRKIRFKYEIRIYRGRNQGNVGCERSGSTPLGLLVTNPKIPFSIYVPGLAGIPQKEEYRTESIIKKGVANGDANLYLRNVLYLIKQNNMLNNLIDYMERIFPDFWLDVHFNQKEDVYIDVKVSLSGPCGKKIPLELAGTGIQQALQIFSYTILFKPSILLLDEPDSHLHPDNQSLLASILLILSSSTNTKIIASTHSRHLVDALYDDANLIWLKDGKIFDQGFSLNRLSLLMDLGALNNFDRLREGTVNWVFLTEDSSKKYIGLLIQACGYEIGDYIIYTYRTSSQLPSAILLADFIKDIAPNTKVIIHRDRDFLTEKEINWIIEKITSVGAFPFITEPSDIEGYFVDPLHLSELLEEDENEIEKWLSELAVEHHNSLVHKFTRKRDDAKLLYRNRDESPPDTVGLLGDEIPMPPINRLGKFMLKKVHNGIKNKFGKNINIIKESTSLKSESLIQIKETN